DLAVLEGGYSIETALPYINLGIILAMAGLDYSHIEEPDYKKERLKQAKDITKKVQNISDKVYNRWKNRYNLKRKNLKGLDYVERPLQVYYDTDGILENQIQNFKVCSKCSGINT